MLSASGSHRPWYHNCRIATARPYEQPGRSFAGYQYTSGNRQLEYPPIRPPRYLQRSLLW